MTVGLKFAGHKNQLMQKTQNLEYPITIIAYSLAVLNNGRLDLNKFAAAIGLPKYLMKRIIDRDIVRKPECAELDGDVLVLRDSCPSLLYGVLHALMIKGRVTISFRDKPPYIVLPEKNAIGILINRGIAYVIRKTKEEVTLALTPEFRKYIETLNTILNTI